ncbi:MAG: VanW family protein [Actinomycetota bacterium]
MGSVRLPRLLTVLLILPIALVLVGGGGLVAAYALDTTGGERTVRGLRVGGLPAGDLSPRELSRVISRLRNEVGGRPAIIDLPGGPARLVAADLGITVDGDAMLRRALEAGDAGTAPDRFLTWLTSFGEPREVPLSLDLDRRRAEQTVRSLEGLVVERPLEPRLVMSTDQEVAVRSGEAGTVVDVEAVVDELAARVEEGGPFRVSAPTTALPPTIDEARLGDVAKELNRITADGITVRLGEEERHLTAAALRIRLDVEQQDGDPRPRFDLESLQRLIEQVFGDVEIGGEDPRFDVVDDEPVVTEEGSPPLECCRDDAAEKVASAVLEEGRDAVRVEPMPSQDPRLVRWAEGEGVVEKVAEFTTQHECCQSRVQNIQRFADIVRGAYLLPGESLSLNEHVGQRTPEKGFVPAGTILQGHLVPTVGGGVSQFATTMFNAAFFAGFDFVTYQSHSIYFSRYPYGREATISWPAPDLEFENTTDFPALIWTSYTDTSITVSIYSTKSVEVEQTGQETSPARACTRVDTYRKRTYEDGREVEDSVFATYRPSEGLDCNGNPTDRPNT